jgi:lipid-A-disaccharide synthase
MEHAQVFTAYPSMAGFINGKSKAVNARPIGDLVKDSLSLEMGTFVWDAQENAKKQGPRLLLFPGSRPAIRRLSLSWLSAVARHLKLSIPQVRIGTLFSPFAPESEFSFWADAGLNPIKVGAGAVMKTADYALTQPGTNTLEMMHCGLPALVAAPMDFLKVIPIAGLGGFASRLPLVGPLIKERGIHRNLKRYNGFISWPNRVANRPLLDETMGKVTPEEVALRVAKSLKDEEKLSRVRRELLALSGEQGAVLRLCGAVEAAEGKMTP